MGNLTALAASQAEVPATHEEALSRIDRLKEHPEVSEVRSALDHFRQALEGMDEVARELAREGAMRRLRELGFTSPGRLVETAMPAAKSGDERRMGLQDPDLWPEQVEGATLLASLEQTVGRFLALTPDQLVPYVLWALFAHAHDAFEISPILAFTSPDKGCGKSTALALLSALVPRPLTSANITPSAVFRVTDYYRPCLLLDEADTFLSDSEGLRGILNSGHMRSQAYVTRVAGDDLQVRMFSTWTPKAIALIGDLPPTLADRSVTIRMRRRARGEFIERLQLHRLNDMEDLRSMAARWASDHLEDLRFFDPSIPGAIMRDRARDNWRPLLAVADLAGGEWPARARASALKLTATSGLDTSIGITLLEDLRALFLVRGNAKVVSEEILGHLHAMEERPWPEWRDRGPLTARQLAGILHPFGITPVKWRQEEMTRRGYDPSQFTDAFSRYLPSVPPHPPQTSFQSTCDQTLCATKEAFSGPLGGDKSSHFTDVADVADANLDVAPRKDFE
jgi:putative DNA primase/helicase